MIPNAGCLGPDETAGTADARGDTFGAVFVVAQHLDVVGDEALAPLGLTTKLAFIQMARSPWR